MIWELLLSFFVGFATGVSALSVVGICVIIPVLAGRKLLRAIVADLRRYWLWQEAFDEVALMWSDLAKNNRRGKTGINK